MLYGNQEVSNAFSNVETVCDKAKDLLDKKEYSEAVALLKEEIKKVKKFKVYGFEEYYAFDEMFQFEIFIHFLSGINAKNKKQRNRARKGSNIIWLREPVTDLYYYCAYALVEIGEFEQALNTLRMGLEWNPCSIDLHFERLNIFRHQRDIENLHREAKETYKYVFRPQHLARIYRDRGYAFIEEEKWDVQSFSLKEKSLLTEDALNRIKIRALKDYIDFEYIILEKDKRSICSKNIAENLRKELCEIENGMKEIFMEVLSSYKRNVCAESEEKKRMFLEKEILEISKFRNNKKDLKGVRNTFESFFFASSVGD